MGPYVDQGVSIALITVRTGPMQMIRLLSEDYIRQLKMSEVVVSRSDNYINLTLKWNVICFSVITTMEASVFVQ